MTTHTTPPTPRRLYRSDEDRMVAGVCGGLADYFETDPTLIRLIFIILSFVGGMGFVIYGALWLILPREKEGVSTSPRDTVQKNAEHIADEIKETLHRAESSYDGSARPQAGLWLVFFGVLFLLANFGLFSFGLIARLWPIILIIVGWQILNRSRR